MRVRQQVNEFDSIVVGNGLFGSAAARHLSRLESRVAVIGPDEQAKITDHSGVFASHYDEGRLTRLVDRNHTWAWATRRAVAGYHGLERASGIRFHHPVGALMVGRRGRHVGHVSDPIEMARDCGIAHDLYQPGDKTWQALFPHLDFPDTHYVLHEPAPAGFINPRRLIQAQNAVAAGHGAGIIREIVVAVRARPGGAVVTTAGGTTYRARKVLVTAGAFTNFNNLLTDDLPLTLKTEAVVLARVAPADWNRLRHMPTVKYEVDSTELEGIYMIPPVRYPDGAYYIKAGANTGSDDQLTTLGQVQAWFRDGSSDASLPFYEEALRAMWPDTDFLSLATKRCIVCYTPGRNPIIDQVDSAIFVAAGGNGGGAKASDAWGELAAGLVHDGRWPDAIPRLSAR
ncbi:MAG: NAD(P)/FAD-dependent oxidoreductase [Acidimicrobiales bacterium]